MEREQRVWLVDLRKKKDLSQQELANKAGISRNYLSEIEIGSKNPSVDVAKRIASVLECEWTIFFNKKRREKQHTA